MRVVHVISGLRGGGAEHFVLELCRESKKQGGVKMVVVCMGPVTTIANKFQEAGIEVHFLKMSADSVFSGSKQFIQIISSQGETVVIHAHMYHAAILSSITRIFHHRPVVFTLHNTHVEQWGRRALLFLTKALRKTDLIFPGTKPSFFQKKNAVPIAYGIDTSIYNYNSAKPEIFTCLFAGRLDAQKNPLYLIDLVKQLPGRRFKIIVAGEGVLQQQLAEQIVENHLQQYFELKGFQPDLGALYANVHCLLLPSLWEGMPMVILEAGASRLPVIATPVGSIPAFLNVSNAFLGDIRSFPGLLLEIMDDYIAAQQKADRWHEEVINKYSIQQSYLSHVQKVYSKVFKNLSL